MSVRRAGAADRRASIIRAALRLFSAGQFHGTTIPELARGAGVAEGTIYNYFDSKEDVALVALAETSAQLLAGLLSSVPRQAGPFEQLSYAAAFLLQAAEEDPIALRFVLSVDHHAYLGERAEQADMLDGPVGLWVANAAARGLTKPLPTPLLSALWIGIVRAAVEARASGHLKEPLPTVADAVAESAIDAIRLLVRG